MEGATAASESEGGAAAPDTPAVKTVSTKNYTTWKLPHLSGRTIAEFEQALTLADGVHPVILPSDVCVDVYFAGDPFAATIERPRLTFFPGAVTGQEKKTG